MFRTNFMIATIFFIYFPVLCAQNTFPIILITGRLHVDHQSIIGHNIAQKEFENIVVLYTYNTKLLLTLK